MKKCLRCSKPAVLHITEIRDNEARAVHLCDSCAKDYLDGGDAAEPDEDLATKISQLADDDDFGEYDDLECPHCGISFSEFRAKGRLGCPQDYIVFADELTSLLENIHGRVEHTGKFPNSGPDSTQKHYQLIKLRNDLRTAIEGEKYEEAATLRDQIQELEASLSDNSPA